MITVVSGLPRSGTSLMMQLLEANGFDILTDKVRAADESNPRGYFEYEKVKSLMKDNSWLHEAEGKAVKVIAQLIPWLSPEYSYNIIFMERDIDEILSSQDKMLERTGVKKPGVSREMLKNIFMQQSEKTISLAMSQSNVKLVKVSFGKLFSDLAGELDNINSALSVNLNVQKSMGIIHPELYREK